MKAAEALAHVHQRVESAFNTLNKLVERAEGTSVTTLKSQQEELEKLMEDVEKKMKQNPKGKWGSFPDTVTTKKTVRGQEYEVEQYQYGGEDHPVGVTERYVLAEMNSLLNRIAMAENLTPKKKGEIPDYIKEHAEKLGDVLREMERMRQENPEHPYNMKRTRTTLIISAD